MTRLDRRDAYRTEFSSVVQQIRERNGHVEVLLKETVFYPTAGGQACDTGWLGEIRVVEVSEDDDGNIWHVLEGNPPVVGAKLEGRIDWARRFDHMQQHTGEHILGQAFFRRDKHVVAVNMEHAVCTLDLAGEVSWEEVMLAEETANAAIWAAYPITTYEIPDSSLETVPLRRAPKVTGMVRVIQIGDYDYSACGGTHLHSSAEVGSLKIFKLERVRGTDTRIFFNCGSRLLSDYRFKHDFVSNLGLRFSTALEAVPERVNASLEELVAAKREVSSLRVRLAAQVAASVTESVYVAQLEDAALLPELAKIFAARPGQIAILGAITESRAMLAVACGAGANAKAGELLKLGLPFIDGRGGGKPDFAQGSGVKLEGLSAALEAMREAVPTA
jgi:alanyl-tRNA synthetase